MTSNDALVQRFQALEVKNTEAMGELRGDIRLLTSEVKRLNDTLSSTSKLMATKEELTAAKSEFNLKYVAHTARTKKLEDWNTWAIRIVVGAVILAGLTALGLTAR